jgi:hypothetical protein
MLVGYQATGMIFEVAARLLDTLSHDRPEVWIVYGLAAAGGIAGVTAGGALASVILRTFPRIFVALAFIAITLFFIRGSLIDPGARIGGQVVRGVVAILATLAMIWPGKVFGDRRDRTPTAAADEAEEQP